MTDNTNRVLYGDCREMLKLLPDESISSIVTDPPYEIGFMGRGWDSSGVANDAALWDECLRVLKPGGFVAAFGAARTYHRMACAIEDAGFEIRDSIHWTYGSGFPKSLDVAKQFDKVSGLHRGKAGKPLYDSVSMRSPIYERNDKGAAVTEDAIKWEGWGTALKPAHEPIVLARKPIVSTVTNNILLHDTGALNIDDSRLGSEAIGRWPANVMVTHSLECDDECALDCPALEIDRQYANADGASKFFYAGTWEPSDILTSIYMSKASKKERNAGLEALKKQKPDRRTPTAAGMYAESMGGAVQSNYHPTVKPVNLMRYLIRMLTPPDGIVLDPFLGSGTTAVAAILEGFNWAGCELTTEYTDIIEARIEWAKTQDVPQTLFSTNE